MTGSTISGHVTISVILGSNLYPNPLTVSPTGFIDPFAALLYGATALTATISGGSVLNQGTIQGSHGVGGSSSPGNTNYTGGIGIYLAGGTLSNAGMIAGGGGGYNVVDTIAGGIGGSGVVAANSSLTNTGTISGGYGGGAGFDYTAGAAGSGADITNSGLINTGLIIGGVGGQSVSFADGQDIGGAGGDGLDAANSSLVNSGTIDGGNGGYGSGVGGAGATVTTDSTLTNSGMIRGGIGGEGGAFATAGIGGDGADITGSSLINTGEIIGGQGGDTFSEGKVANGGAGISLQDGVLTNHGQITGGYALAQSGLMDLFFASGGVGVSATNSSIANDGTIAGGGGGGGGVGVNLVGSTLTNDGLIQAGAATSTGDFNAGPAGVTAANSTILNYGTILGPLGFFHGGAGVEITNSDLTNIGSIGGASGRYGGTGVDVTSSVFTNTGSISGGNGSYPSHSGVGVLFHGGGTLTNGGYIGGGVDPSGIADAVNFGSGPARLIDDPGAAFFGNVVAQGAFTTLELTSAASIGTITGIGTSFTGFGTITVDPDATWVVTGSVTSSDTIGLGADSDLTFDGGVAATSPVYFTANTGTVSLADPADFAGAIYGFQIDNAIDFTSITSADPITAGVDSANDLTLTGNGILLTEIRLDPAQNFADDVFHAMPDGGSGTVVTATPLCFLPGTMIAVPSGETPVERLGVGDMVVTAHGDHRRIVWIGIGRVLATRGRRSAATPVIVRKGALADNVPHSDLRVTSAHGLCLEGMLIPVEFLVNHRSILWDDQAQEVALYHVELETHDVLLANGAPAESYRDDGNRWLFQNANTGWDHAPKPLCAPVLTGGPVVDAVWSDLLDRAGPRPGMPLTDDPDLHLLIDCVRLDAGMQTGDSYIFNLGHMPTEVRVISRAAAPQELGLARDPRRLGVALRQVIVRQRTRFRKFEAADKRLIEGFHEFEEDEGFRWTDGDGLLPTEMFAGFTGPIEVVLHIGATAQYVEGVATACAA